MIEKLQSRPQRFGNPPTLANHRDLVMDESMHDTLRRLDQSVGHVNAASLDRERYILEVATVVQQARRRHKP